MLIRATLLLYFYLTTAVAPTKECRFYFKCLTKIVLCVGTIFGALKTLFSGDLNTSGTPMRPLAPAPAVAMVELPQHYKYYTHRGDFIRSKMSIETINHDKVIIDGSSSCIDVMGWEDVAIVVKDTRYSSNENHMLAPTYTIESSYQQQYDVDCEVNVLKHDATIPSSVPVGSSDDSYSSDSTDFSGISLSSGHDGSGSISKDSSEEEDHSTTSNLSQLHISLEPNDLRRDESSELVSEVRIRKNVETVPLKSKVQFSTVQVRDYDITLGDHPYCDMYPLSLDWTYTDILTTTTDDFEENHRRHVPNETRVFSPVVARKILKKGKGVNTNNMVQVRARKLSVMERMSLLIEFTGSTSQQLYQLERKRQLLAQDEKLLNGINASLSFV